MEEQQLVKGLLRRAPICGRIGNASLERIVNNKDSWMKSIKNVVFLSNTYITSKKSLKVNKQKKMTLEEMEFLKKYEKFTTEHEVTFSIDAKYRNQITEHCSDMDSYYFPPLNECYRIYQTPYSNLDASYIGDRNELAYGTSQYDYMYNCWELYHRKLLDIGEVAIGEKMELVKKMVLQFYYTTGQHDAIRVGFMISRDYEMVNQNSTFYDVLDGVYVKMHPTEPCDNICCVVIKLSGIDEVEMEQASCDYTFIPNFFCQKRGNL